MQKILKRQEIKYLQEWSSRRVHKPLVIRGARQVGKSTLVREFVRLADMPMVEVNFERNPEFREAFAERDPARIVSTLALLTAREITPAATVLFLDEIQAAPEALVALRYFHEEMPQLRVVAAGSLMEFALADARFSMPVARVEYMHLGPMEFEDFLEASGNAPLATHLRSFSLSDLSGGENVAFPAAVHRRCLDLLRQYCVVGGLPEAVAAYVDADTSAGEEFARVSRVQQGIVSAYRDDFHKYGHGSLRDRIQLVFDKLPAMVGRKFKYVQVSRDHRAAEISEALRHLCLAGVATRIPHTAANGVPLAAEANERHFKCLCMDVGLMCGALHLNVLDLARDDLTVINGGALAEQFVGQHLLFSGPRYQAPSLYYWVREARNAAAEIDYLMTAGQRIVPVEIKAGTTGSLRSLHQFLQEKQRDFGLRFNADVPSLLRDAKRLSNGTAIDYHLLSLPIYMAGQARRLVGEFDRGDQVSSVEVPVDRALEGEV